MQRFAGKTVVVTGAGSGIGAAAALRFGAEGANVVLVGRRQGKLDEVAAELDPARTLTVAVDVTIQSQVHTLFERAITRFHTVEVLVNSAGAASLGGFATMGEDVWRQIMATNVDGVFHMIRAALPHLLKGGGSIVNVTSVSGLGGDWGVAFYNAAKGAVTNLTRALALEYGGQGVRVNAVAPSLTRTEMTAGIEKDAQLLARFIDRIPMGRSATAAEVASVIAFLASPDASFVNGVNLPVDGGLSASSGQPRLI